MPLGNPSPAVRPFLAVLGALAAFASVVCVASPAGALPRCTITGTAAAERIVGTAGRDVICGKDGDDVLLGRGGNDTLIGDGGADRLVGGPGGDDLFAGAGADTLEGGEGADELGGGGGNDAVLGGAGSDVVVGEAGNDDVRGQDGDDLVYGDAGRDRMSGGAGRDTVTYRLLEDGGVRIDLDGVADDGSPGERDLIGKDFENLTGSWQDDVITGDDGANVIDASHGNDRVYAGAGPDTLIGGDYRDELFGEGGDDVLRGGPYNDLLAGGAGADTIVGGTAEPRGRNVCDDDPADARVVECTRDSRAPTIVNVSAGEPPMRRGDRFELAVSVDDTAGIDDAGIRVTKDGQPVDMCAGLQRHADREAPETYWTAACRVPAGAQLGGYVITPWATDRLGHGVNLDPGSTASRDASIPVVGADVDTTRPLVKDIRVEGGPVLAPGDRLTVYADVEDPSGVMSAIATIRVEGRPAATWCGDGGGTRVPGTPVTDGTWRFECQVPDLVRNGVHTVSVSATDFVSGWEDPAAGAVTPTVEVTGGSDDSTAPEVTAVSVDKQALTPGESFRVTTTLQDPSGVSYAYLATRLDGTDRQLCGPTPAVRVGGDELNGTWQFSCTVPAQVLNGTYEIGVYGGDRLGNSTIDGGTTTATVEVTGGSDGAGPSILALSATPDRVSTGDAVTVRAELSDPVGVEWVMWWFTDEHGTDHLCPGGEPVRVADGPPEVWAGTCTVPASFAPGVYTVRPVVRNTLGSYTRATSNDGTNYRETSFEVLAQP